MRLKMLGNTTSSAPCICCNERLVDKGTARSREKRQWFKDVELGDGIDPDAYRIFDGPPANKMRC